MASCDRPNDPRRYWYCFTLEQWHQFTIRQWWSFLIYPSDGWTTENPAFYPGGAEAGEIYPHPVGEVHIPPQIGCIAPIDPEGHVHHGQIEGTLTFPVEGTVFNDVLGEVIQTPLGEVHLIPGAHQIETTNIEAGEVHSGDDTGEVIIL